MSRDGYLQMVDDRPADHKLSYLCWEMQCIADEMMDLGAEADLIEVLNIIIRDHKLVLR